jgi:hypothetical protein
MAAYIISNNIPDLDRRERSDAAILAAIGNRDGDWKAYIFNPQITDERGDVKNYYVTIEGPGFEWKYEFGPFEHDPQIIHDIIAANLPIT